jgi:hypothetical protein
MKFTKSPWTISILDGSKYLVINNADSEVVADIHFCAEYLDNAHLIASSPELFRTLQLVEAWFSAKSPSKHRIEMHLLVKSILAKVNGKL